MCEFRSNLPINVVVVCLESLVTFASDDASNVVVRRAHGHCRLELQDELRVALVSTPSCDDVVPSQKHLCLLLTQVGERHRTLWREVAAFELPLSFGTVVDINRAKLRF